MTMVLATPMTALEISTLFGDIAVGKDIDQGVVCPFILRNILFATAAMDNIDRSPTNTTATTSFHGTIALPGYNLQSQQL